MGSLWHSFLYLGQPHFWERKLWGEICFLMLCWSSYLLSSQMGLATEVLGTGPPGSLHITCHLQVAIFSNLPPIHEITTICIVIPPLPVYFHSSFSSTVVRDCLEWQRATEGKKWWVRKGNPVGLLPQACVFVCLKSAHDCWKNSIFIFCKLSCETVYLRNYLARFEDHISCFVLNTSHFCN